jgi:hypothetical protein
VPAGDKKGSNELNITTLAKVFQKANLLLEKEKKKTISFSGLLNIIDSIFLLIPFFFSFYLENDWETNTLRGRIPRRSRPSNDN